MRNNYPVIAHLRRFCWTLTGLFTCAATVQAQVPHAMHQLPIANPNTKPPSSGAKPAAAQPAQQPQASGAATSYAVAPGQGDDVHLFASSNPQTEVHISIDKSNPCNLIASANTNAYAQGYYYSHDGGLTWQGSDNLPNNGQSSGDPSTAYDAGGNAYLATMAHVQDGYFVQSSADKGNTWTNQVRASTTTAGYFDKDMIAADNTLGLPTTNNLYAAWNDDLSGTIQFNRSVNRGQSFTTPLVLANTGGEALGANVQTGPNGEVYVCWANYPSSSSDSNPQPANSIGFVRSTNGGASFTPAAVAFNIAGMAVQGNKPDPTFNGIRVNDLPAMAVDKAGPHRGRIYITHNAKENGSGKSVVLVRYSDNQGVSWSTPVTVSISSGRQNWMPWIAVDDTNGDVSVVYYSFDNTVSGYDTNTYVAYSRDGGVSFSNVKVSDASHTTAPVESTPTTFAAGYVGDYIGITAFGGKAYPTWTDNRSGTWQIYTSPIAYNTIMGPDQVCASGSFTFQNSDNATVQWTATPANLFTVSSGSGVQFSTAGAAGAQGTGTITATRLGGCAPGVSKTVAVGSATPTGHYTYNTSNLTLQATNFVPYTYITISLDQAFNFTFTATSHTAGSPPPTLSSTGSSTSFRMPSTERNRIDITATATNSPCSLSGTFFFVPTGPPPATAYAVSPNPASSNLTVADETANTAAPSTEPFEAELYDIYGKKVKIEKSDRGKAVLDTRDVPDGLYNLRVDSGKHPFTSHVQIAH